MDMEEGENHLLGEASDPRHLQDNEREGKHEQATNR
jgi:hypothetical protein